MRPSSASSTIIGAYIITLAGSEAFIPGLQGVRLQTRGTTQVVQAKPQRLDENVDGVIYVNDRCINCAACSNFAPATFSRSPSDRAHIVHEQPKSEQDIRQARAALSACPVAAIRLETLAERRHRAGVPEEKKLVEESWSEQDEQIVRQMTLKSEVPFPRKFLDDDSLKNVYWLGHHNEKSFGATPYLLQASLKDQGTVWIMVDSPKFNPSAVKAVESLTGPQGPDFLFLTHVDDTDGHKEWAEHYKGNLKRIFHSGDLGPHNWLGDESLEHVEILLPHMETSGDEKSLRAYNLNGDALSLDWQESLDNSNDEVIILHTPGHSPGSISLYRLPTKDGQPGILFTGDTYGFTTRGGGKMTAFSQYGNDLSTQAETLKQLVTMDWDIVAPGHAHPRDYRQASLAGNKNRRKEEELQIALEDMNVSRYR